MSDKKPDCGCAVEVNGHTRRVRHSAECTVQAERVAAREASLAEMAATHPDPRFSEAAKAALAKSKALRA